MTLSKSIAEGKRMECEWTCSKECWRVQEWAFCRERWKARERWPFQGGWALDLSLSPLNEAVFGSRVIYNNHKNGIIKNMKAKTLVLLEAAAALVALAAVSFCFGHKLKVKGYEKQLSLEREERARLQSSNESLLELLESYEVSTNCFKISNDTFNKAMKYKQGLVVALVPVGESCFRQYDVKSICGTLVIDDGAREAIVDADRLNWHGQQTHERRACLGR